MVFIPKCRRKTIYGAIKRELGPVFHTLTKHKESRIEEGHLMGDHVHMLLAIPPKYAVANVVGYIKGKSAMHVARTFGERKRNFVGQHFWARGYLVSTVGRDEAVIREYIRNPDKEDKRLEQLTFISRPPPSGGSQPPLVSGTHHSRFSGSRSETPRLCRGIVSP